MRKGSSLTVTDLFCGAGGSTTGAIQAGADVRLAINHWPRALETHNTNYPAIDHALTDISQADPRHYPSTTILIASPECTNHSLAKGKKRFHRDATLWEPAVPPDPAEERSRCTMWDPLRFAEVHDYQIIILENVIDACSWRMWDAWLQAWQSLNYTWEIVSFNSMFASPTPQSRDRLYAVFWKKGNPAPKLRLTPLAHCPKCDKKVTAMQVWKKPARRFGKYRQQYVYCCSICATKIIPDYTPAASAIDWSLPAPRIGDRAKPLREKTMQRIADGLKKFSKSPFILDHIGEYRQRSINVPLPTIVGGGNHHSLVTPPAWLLSYYQHGQLVPVNQAVPTITTLDRHALVTGKSTGPLTVEDCGFRMLVPKEIQAAMAFPQDYIVTGTRREQIKQLGNAVTPPVIKMLMERCLASLS
jgi:DNA (cytosine-5)-methyltransferase 1